MVTKKEKEKGIVKIYDMIFLIQERHAEREEHLIALIKEVWFGIRGVRACFLGSAFVERRTKGKCSGESGDGTGGRAVYKQAGPPMSVCVLKEEGQGKFVMVVSSTEK